MKLRPYQQAAIDGLIEWFLVNPDGHPLIEIACGGGKSVVNAKICEFALSFENQRILCLTHIKELIEQNYNKFAAILPNVSAGIYCAGLGKKQLQHAVTFASIQSIHAHYIEAGFVNLCIIDEAHLLSDSDSGIYRKFLGKLREINPKMRIIGLTATPYRTKTGLLHRGEGAIFTDIAYRVDMRQLINEGYLVRMLGKQAKTQGDISGLHTRAGEFIIREAENIFDEEKLVQAACDEMLAQGADRKTWLVFCVSIKHAEHVAKVLNERGIPCASVSNKTPEAERAKIIDDLRFCRLRAATNVSVLTTGTDIPNIDMIVVLRPTQSPGLFLQMAGRGFRPVYAPNMPLDTVEERLAAIADSTKPDCLMLDMAGNLLSHGPLTHIVPPDSNARENKEIKKGKACPACDSVMPSHFTECLDCGFVFEGVPRKIKHAESAHTEEAMIIDSPPISDIPQWYRVKSVKWHKHEKLDSKPSLRMIYSCPPYKFSEWIPFESEKGRGLAASWWMRHFTSDVPKTTDEAIERINESGFHVTRIKVSKKDDQLPRIKEYA